jgi:hypothetical protein
VNADGPARSPPSGAATVAPPAGAVQVTFKRSVGPRPFNHCISMHDATPTQPEFLSIELPRFEACGACESAHHPCYMSRIFLVPKPGTN